MLLNKKEEEKLHIFIYYYPIRKYRYDIDTAGEFYAYFLPRLERILKRYEKYQGRYSWEVYLAFQLRKYFHRFISKKKKEEEKEKNLEKEEIHITQQTIYHYEEEENPYERLYQALSRLELIEEMVIRLLYAFPLLLKHFRYLVELHGGKAFSLYREYQKEIEKALEKEHKEKKLLQESLSSSKIKPIIPYKKVASLLKKSIASIHRIFQKALEKLKKYLS